MSPENNSPSRVTVSSDGVSVYVIAADSMSFFSREPVTGDLTWQLCDSTAVPPNAPPPGCQWTAGLLGASDVAVTADAHSVYTSSVVDSAVTVFQRLLN